MARFLGAFLLAASASASGTVTQTKTQEQKDNDAALLAVGVAAVGVSVMGDVAAAWPFRPPCACGTRGIVLMVPFRANRSFG